MRCIEKTPYQEQWKTPASPGVKNVQMLKSKKKKNTTPIVFFNIRRIIMVEYVTPNETVNHSFSI
jgi:hypothetical protein